MRIVKRILCFPFIAIIGLISAIVGWAKFCAMFAWYGGETLSYKKNTRKCVADLFDIFEKGGFYE